MTHPSSSAHCGDWRASPRHRPPHTCEIGLELGELPPEECIGGRSSQGRRQPESPALYTARSKHIIKRISQSRDKNNHNKGERNLHWGKDSNGIGLALPLLCLALPLPCLAPTRTPNQAGRLPTVGKRAATGPEPCVMRTDEDELGAQVVPTGKVRLVVITVAASSLAPRRTDRHPRVEPVARLVTVSNRKNRPPAARFLRPEYLYLRPESNAS